MIWRVLAVGLVCSLAWFVGFRMGVPEAEPPEEKSTVELKPGPSVLLAVQALARLEGASYHMQRVIDLREKQSRFWGLIEAEDAILLVASGEVTAGIDLSKLGDRAIVIEEQGRHVKVVLPHAQVLSSKIDNDRTYVHSRSTDTLAQQALTLESKARKEAEAGFVEAALAAGVLSDAEKNIGHTVRSLIVSLGYQQVDVVFEGEPQENVLH